MVIVGHVHLWITVDANSNHVPHTRAIHIQQLQSNAQSLAYLLPFRQTLQHTVYMHVDTILDPRFLA